MTERTETRHYGFPPIVGSAPRVLVLGSAPSVASLEKHQYYGKPQNAFWKIMGEFFDAGPELAYEKRTARLAEHGIAVWDVLASFVRPGSLDSSIRMGSIRVNDFAGFFAQHPGIHSVFFNGRKSEEIFRRYALTTLGPAQAGLRYTSLPSTSPAMASLNFEAKLRRWRLLKRAVEMT